MKTDILPGVDIPIRDSISAHNFVRNITSTAASLNFQTSETLCTELRSPCVLASLAVTFCLRSTFGQRNALESIPARAPSVFKSFEPRTVFDKTWTSWLARVFRARKIRKRIKFRFVSSTTNRREFHYPPAPPLAPLFYPFARAIIYPLAFYFFSFLGKSAHKLFLNKWISLQKSSTVSPTSHPTRPPPTYSTYFQSDDHFYHIGRSTTEMFVILAMANSENSLHVPPYRMVYANGNTTRRARARFYTS